jgi:hypothetical protein
MSTDDLRSPRLRSVVAVLTAILALALPHGAGAEGVRYPASLCRQHAGPGTFLYFSSVVAPGLPVKSEPRHNGGTCPPPQAGGCPPCASLAACRNDPAFSARLDCPIPKTFPDNGIADVTVDVIDRHEVLNVECFLTSVVWNAAINDFQQNSRRLETTGSGNGIRPLKVPPQTAAGPAAHWYVACTLPANSALVSYYVNEN